MATPTTPEQPPSLPRYRGLHGALAYGLLLFGLVALLAVLAGGAILLLTGAFALAVHVATRSLLVGLVLGGAPRLGRWICVGTSDRLWDRRATPGDWGGVIAGLLGVFLAGSLERSVDPSLLGFGRPSDAPANGLASGQPVEISGPTLDGGRFDLADHRGKVVLVDFWATWCRPCLAELPNVQAAYDKYHDDGLDVVSISLDWNRSALDHFLEARPLPWPQIFFDPTKTGGDNPLARRFGIDAIPCMLVVDREGRLIARDVRGPEIATTVAEALGQPVSSRDRLASGGWRIGQWFFRGLLTAPFWLTLACGWGCGILGGIIEANLRRLLRRRPPATV
jgi:thiol-disulfide isomerase/thioredoxin